MNANILLTLTQPVEIIYSTRYFIVAVLAVILLGYLIYSLIKPEKF